MATKNIVPRSDKEGQLGTNAKQWNKVIAHTGSFQAVSSSLIPDAADTYDLGSSTKFWKDLYISSGSINFIDPSDNSVSSTISVASDGTLNIGSAIVSGSSIPDADNEYDLGSSSKQWKDLYINGTANIDTLTLSSGASVTSILDEDAMGSDSATALATQQSIKAYVDSQVTAQDLDATTDSGTIDIDLDSETLTIAGGEGIDTSATGTTITIAGEEASTSNKGVASFSSDNFAVSSGVVTIKDSGVANDELAGSIANAKLANSSITLTQGAGMGSLGAVSLGGSVTVGVDGVLEDLDTLGAASSDGEIIVATGAGAFAYESGATLRTSIGVDAAGTDNSTDVTLVTTSHDYLSISGQAITLGTIDIGDDTNLVGGDGLALSGDTLAVNVDDSSIEINSDTLRVKASGITNAMLGGSIANAKLANSTISGVSLGSNLNNLTVDDTTIQLNSGTTYNGSAARTISGKTAAIANGGAALATADQIHTFVTTQTDSTAADTSGNAATATLASTVTVSDSTANTNFPVAFHNESNALLDDTGTFTYNPSTSTLVVPNINVSGTQTFVDTANLVVTSSIIFEGATADGYETTLTVVDPTADRTITLPNATDTVALLAATQTFTNKTLTSPDVNTPDIDGGTIDGATIATSNITVGSGKTLDVSGGTLTLANDQISGDKINGGTIGSTTITALTTAGITATANIDIGAYELRAQTLESDVSTGTAPLTIASTTLVSNLNADLLDGQEGSYYLDFGNFVIDNDEIPIAKLASDSVSYGGVSVTLGGSDATPAFDLQDATGYPTSELVGTITNAQLAGSIANAKLSNSAITIDGTSVSLGGSISTNNTVDMGDGFVIEDGDGTEVTITENKEVKFVEGGGIDINWTDTSDGTDGDPYDLTFTNTGVTSIVAGSNISIDQSTGAVTITSTDTNTTYTGGTNLTLSGTTFNVDDAFLKNDADDTTSGTLTAANFVTSGKVGSSTNDEFFDFGTDAMIKVEIDDVEDFRFADGGTFHARADVIAYSSTPSDERLKDNVVTIDSGLSLVNQLRGVTFDWNQGSKQGTRDIGVIAQEVEKVLPELVKENELPLITDSDETYKTVDYEKLTAVLIEAVKDLSKEIDDIKQKCDCLNK